MSLGWTLGKQLFKAGKGLFVETARERAKKEGLEAIARGGVATATSVGKTAKSGSTREAQKVFKKEFNELNPNAWKRLPTWAKWTLPPGVAAAATGAFALFGGDDVPAYDLSKLDLPKAGVISPEQAALDAKYREDSRQAVRDSFGYTPIVPGSEIYDPTSAVTNQLGAASVLSMQDIANQYAQGAAATRARGAQAGQSINDIYGGSAATLETLGAQPSSEYDAMIPVSGEAAVAPDQQRMAGQNLSNYLTQNQLINSQAQGGMAELANMLGPAYANQYALMDKQFRMEADANKTRMEAQYSNEKAKNLAEALANLEIMEAQSKYERDREALASGAISVADPAEVDRYAGEYGQLSDARKQYYMQEAGVKDIEDWIRFRVNQARQGS
jgi:hypothetical protein